MTASDTTAIATSIPGQILGTLSSHLPGAGTHVHENKIRASIAGFITISNGTTTPKSKPVISVSRKEHTSDTQITQSKNLLPTVGTTVLARVLRVQQRQLTTSILVVLDPNTTSNIIPYTVSTSDEVHFQATLRKEDVRAYEKDKVVMNEMFRVGDVIKAVVISLGDERNYYISTAGNEYGVVVAKSDAGNAMVPASWKEMRDIVTGKGESRKVAKPT